MNSVIAVVGCGSIGMRHVEALGRLLRPVRVYAVDTSEEATNRAKSLFEATRTQAGTAAEIVTVRSIDEIPGDIDLAIVATAAQGRLGVIRSLLSARQVKAMILEKFLFPRAADYATASEVLGSLRERVWVNCTRRVYPSYRKVAEQIRGAKFVDLRVSGRAAATPIGAIGIHFVDLLAFLGQDKGVRLSATGEDITLFPTRRDVDDFAGVVNVQSEDRRLRLRYSALTQTEAPHSIFIDTDKAQWVIQEWCSTAYIATPETSWRLQATPFAIPYQSQLTDLIAEEILSKGGCGLPGFEESTRLHLCLMAPLQDAYRLLKNDPRIDAVPFT
jgi:predicted dehydrogenase